MSRFSERQLIGLVLTVIISAVVVGLAIFTLANLKVIPADYTLYFYATIWFVGAVLVAYLISEIVKKRLGNFIGASNATSVAFITRLLGYIIAFIGFFLLVHVSIGAALAAGGFAGLVLGLASQTVLSNIFGGIMLLFSRPYKVGDRITISTWQYGLIAPTYPPKFFSNDFLIPGYTGVVTDISLLYTTIYTDDKVPVKIPNSIMVQAAIFIHNSEEVRKIRSKYEVPKDLDPETVIKELKPRIEKIEGVLEVDIKVLETTFTTYILGIDTLAKSIFEEPIRDQVLRITMKTIKELQIGNGQKQLAKS
ncbi:mechanosensitive ion channel family protein [Acidianus ambivalens]|uniref:Mechanosensitive ion channel n=1 Tax=Acidianus ambivalens TaxID=2283 RepID=A0A650CYL8_ACIAM|nr:mechanosensitive ion channel family protein [Acidianus ambivalens]MQL54938.1 mechanosensitive ion channel [Acidianus ambivalens]QGR22722.1 mechanosensitive ion channel [Acidianus ambivalens]